LDPTQPGSGQVKFEEIGNLACVTWDGVYGWGSTQANTMQFQFDLASGDVHMIWQGIQSSNNGLLVGYSPGGPSLDVGSTDLSLVLPSNFTLLPDIRQLTLAANPAPVSSPTSGTLVTFTTSNMPALSAGTFLGVHLLSLNPTIAPGIDLAPIGAPGCFAHIGAIGLSQFFVGTTSTATVALSIPPGIPGGTRFFSQTVALFPPNSLPGGQNAFGLVSSNAVTSSIWPQ
jgi:hypothetical protein